MTGFNHRFDPTVLREYEFWMLLMIGLPRLGGPAPNATGHLAQP
jgi:hypothetical protein